MPCPHLLLAQLAAHLVCCPCGAEGARIFVVVDTNILLSHLSFLRQTFDDFMGQAMEARWGVCQGEGSSQSSEERRLPQQERRGWGMA